MDRESNGSERKKGRLYLCATPMGNLEDITLRALRVLRDVARIAAEDTRHTRKLLSRYEISTPLTSYHEFNEETKARELVDLLLAGEDVAVVSDAGTPALSDPGFELVRAAIRAGIEVVPIPGPTAVISALVGSGLPPHPFYFGGFLPRKAKERRELFNRLGQLEATLVFYESPHRLGAALRDLAETMPGRNAVVARELTKVHEEFRRGTVEDLAGYYGETKPRGECVLLIEGAVSRCDDEGAYSDEEIKGALRAAIESGKSKKEAIKEVASFLGVGRKIVYQAAINLSIEPPAKKRND